MVITKKSKVSVKHSEENSVFEEVFISTYSFFFLVGRGKGGGFLLWVLI